MTSQFSKQAFAILALLSLLGLSRATSAQDPLPSWNDGPAKQSILQFVRDTTDQSSAKIVPRAERIAVFDNDGTLWCEQPMYVQFMFAIDRVKFLAPQHPEWKDQEPFKSILAGDVRAALAGGEKAVVELLAATHAGMTTGEFEATVRQWITTAKHPTTGRLYVQMVYQPMLKLLAYLRANGFKTFIVSGGGVEFMRPWTERVYAIPPEQVVGSRGKLKYEVRDGVPVLVKLPQIDLVDDKEGKPVGIQQVIGRRPIAAFGNSDGDYEMLRWTTAGETGSRTTRLAVIVHHTDAEREYAYDRESHIGKLDRALDEAAARGWVVVDMRTDWKVIFPPPDP
jgi:phosphoglycolate phosphatase-like HAD superfamily hydrolase